MPLAPPRFGRWTVITSAGTDHRLQAGVVAMSRRPLEAFSHASILPHGSDLPILLRTSLGGINRHDTNLAALHRVPRFRGLAPDL
jgi:hypothetical protein